VRQPKIKTLIVELKKAGVKREEEKKKVTGPCVGFAFVITGTLPSMSWGNAHEAIREWGEKPLNSVSSKTSCLIANENPGSKLANTEKLGVKTISSAEFEKMFK
jgi:DNA ligase (NAD+)